MGRGQVFKAWGSMECMKLFAIMLAVCLLLCGCPQEQGHGREPGNMENGTQVPAEPSGGEDMDDGAEIPEPSPECTTDLDCMEQNIGNVCMQGICGYAQEPENEEEKLLQWDIGITLDDEEEGHRQLEGIEFDNGYLLMLEGLTSDSPQQCAQISIGEQGDEYIDKLFQDTVCPGESAYWTSGEGDEYRISIIQTGEDYAGYEYWAEAAVYRKMG